MTIVQVLSVLLLMTAMWCRAATLKEATEGEALELLCNMGDSTKVQFHKNTYNGPMIAGYDANQAGVIDYGPDWSGDAIITAKSGVSKLTISKVKKRRDEKEIMCRNPDDLDVTAILEAYTIKVYERVDVSVTEEMDKIMCKVGRKIYEAETCVLFTHSYNYQVVRELLEPKAPLFFSYNPSSYEDRGQYECSVKTCLGGYAIEKSSKTFEGNVASFFVKPPKTFILRRDSVSDLSVIVYGTVEHFKWTDNTKSVSSFQQYNEPTDFVLRFHDRYLRVQGTVFTLKVKDVKAAATGKYTLTINDDISRSISVVVYGVINPSGSFAFAHNSDNSVQQFGVAAIVGISVGGAVFIAMLIGLGYYCMPSSRVGSSSNEAM